MSDGKACEMCEKFFNEFDLDLHNGMWLCRICEDDLKQIDIEEICQEDGNDLS